MQKGTKMIYDAMDALKANNPDKNKTDLLSMIDRIEGKVTAMIDLADEMTAAIQTRDKEIARLLRALQAKDEKIALYEQALEVACEEIEELCNMLSKTREYHGVIEEPCDRFDIDNTSCDNDCGVCLKNYFLAKGKDRIDMRCEEGE